MKALNVFFNWKLLLSTLLIVGAIGGAVFLLHRQQMKSISSEYLQLAEAAKAKEDWKGARSYLDRYLLQHPDDAAIRAERAELFDKSATTPGEKRRSIAFCLAAIGLCEAKEELKPNVSRLRRHVAKRQFELSDYSDAIDQIAMVAEESTDPELMRLFALCRFRLSQRNILEGWSAKAASEAPTWLAGLAQSHHIDLLESALANNPGDIELTEALAIACLQNDPKIEGSSLANATKSELTAKAKSISEAMQAANSDSPDAWLIHYRIMKMVDSVAADETIENARTRFPNDPQVGRESGRHYFAIAQSMDRNDPRYLSVLDKAEECLRAASKAVTGDADVVDPVSALNLGAIQAQRGKMDEAILIWKQGIRGLTGIDKIALYGAIITNLTQTGKFEEARATLMELDQSLVAGSSDRGPGDNLSADRSEEFKAQTKAAKEIWAEYHLRRNDHESAIPILEFLVATSSSDNLNQQAQKLYLLAQAYMKSQQWDKAGTTYEQASAILPKEPRFHSGAANAWQIAGRANQALSHLNSITNKSRRDLLCEAIVILELQSTPSAEPKLWGAFDDAIASLKKLSAETAIPDSDDPLDDSSDASNTFWLVEQLKLQGDVLRASDAARPNAIQEASAILMERCRNSPENVPQWRGAAQILASWSKFDSLNELLTEFRIAHPESDEAIRTKADQLAKEGKLQEARQVLIAGLKDSSSPGGLKSSIDRVLFYCEDQTRWLEAFNELIKWSDKSLGRSKLVAEAGLDFANFSGRGEAKSDASNDSDGPLRAINNWSNAIQKIEDQIKSMEGDAGTEWRAVRAQRSLNLAELNPNTDLQPIIEITRSLESQRPLWSTTHVIAGLLAERMNDLDGAIKSLNRAVSLGEKEIKVFEKLAALLFQKGMYDEAKKVVDMLGARAGRSRQLSSIVMNLPGNQQSSLNLLELAQAGVEARPIDPMAWIWLGQLLESNSRNSTQTERTDQLAKAYEAFDKAVQLNVDRDMRVLESEFLFYSFLGDKAKLNELLIRLQNATGLEDFNRYVTMAKVEQVLGKMPEAEANFRKAMDAGGSRMEIGMMLAKHLLLSGKEDLAVEQFEKLFRDFPKDFSVRRSLVELLQRRGSAGNWERIQSILLDPTNANAIQDRRLLAEIHFNRGTAADLEKAKTLLEEITADSASRTINDTFILARTYERLAKDDRYKLANDRERLKLNQLADKFFRMATDGPSPNPGFIKIYGDFLVESKQVDQAVAKWNQLKSIVPKEFITAHLGAKIKQAQNQPEQAVDVILQWQKDAMSNLPPVKEKQRSQLILSNTIVALLGVGAILEADQRIDELMQMNPIAAFECMVLCTTLEEIPARSHALQRLVVFIENDTSDDKLMRLVQAIANQEYTPESRQAAEALLLVRDSKNTTNAAVHMRIGDFWLERGDIPQAIVSYRHVIALDPVNVMALNNLACLIAESTGDTEESIVFIDQALKTAGNLPDLLDSKGLILMQQGKHLDAAPLFEIATAKGGDPRYVFHWYVALLKSGRTADAARLRARIDFDALRTKHLSPDDLKELEKLNPASL